MRSHWDAESLLARLQFQSLRSRSVLLAVKGAGGSKASKAGAGRVAGTDRACGAGAGLGPDCITSGIFKPRSCIGLSEKSRNGAKSIAKNSPGNLMCLMIFRGMEEGILGSFIRLGPQLYMRLQRKSVSQQVLVRGLDRFNKISFQMRLFGQYSGYDR